MAAFSSLLPLSPLVPTKPLSSLAPIPSFISTLYLRSPPSPSTLHLHASRRISNYTQEGGLVSGPRRWGRGAFDEDDGDDETDDEDEEDRSLDLLVRFIQNVFRKISRRARKAVRSVLPIAISTRLVRFSVNGVIILAFLWVLKAFLEVVCTLGSIVFVSILLIRVIWSGVSYFQESRFVGKTSGTDDDSNAWTGAQPAM
ncbi:hypothetical protein MRB53_007120 [Persea americana]|uniref:Uncharacterized protein n=1 Tax=Persea americana TaxID=3435 RepID=A0ACC2MHX8_PERAE|nr:hypothetical protein MRB53_007120 [Persea americana]|eukprot:TRINITY_DN10909_c0_g1_i1.p1 TRINITY_DN10909_c0_g1~~TRINITY_DN10909_c0_g1_i1.p1  ORF type:complete len:207 (+),score=30.36 TRINITY_DN10909_c0_g1_i1:23-622(+)